MSVIYHNAVIHQNLPGVPPFTGAVAIDRGAVAAVGTGEELSQRYPQATLIDLDGAVILPGLVDAHAHLYGMGERLSKPRLENAKSKEEVYAILRNVAAMGIAEPSIGGPAASRQDWIVSRGWDHTRWPAAADGVHRFPDRHDLDRALAAAAPERPIALTRVDGHALWCNSQALRVAGIDRTTPDPLGGAILKDTNGEPTGILIDEAMRLVEQHIPSSTDEELERVLRIGLQHFLERGHVAAHEMGVGEDLWRVYERLYDAHHDQLPRAEVFLDMTKPTGKALFLKWSDTGTAPRRDRKSRLRFAGIKLYLDGALGSRGAELFEDYSDAPGERGLALMAEDEVIDLMRRAARMQVQIAVHAIGDKANARALDLFERAGVVGAGSVLRIEHAQIVRESELMRFRELGVHAVVQPPFFASDRHWAIERLGVARMRTAYRWRSLLQSGISFVASSDAPIEEPDTLSGLRLLTARDGVEDGESLTQEEALMAYAEAAHRLTGDAMATERPAGRIVPGAMADLTILSRDHRTVRAVIIDGSEVYTA